MPSINLRLNEEQHRALQVEAMAHGRSLQKHILHRLFASQPISPDAAAKITLSEMQRAQAAALKQADDVLGDTDFSAPRGGVKIPKEPMVVSTTLGDRRPFRGPDLKPSEKKGGK